MDILAIKEAISCPVPSISTPFTRDGQIDWEAVDRIVDFLLSNGAKSLLLTCGDSLMTILTDREMCEIAKRVIDRTAGRAMVLCGGKAWCTSQVLEYMRYVRDAGADVGLPLIVDWAQSSGVEEMTELLKASGKIIPSLAMTNMGRGLPLEVFRNLIDSKAEGFAGAKDDMCGPYGRRLAALLGGRYAFLSGGRAENHLDVAPYGADGYLSIYMRFKPEWAWKYWKLYKAGDMAGCAKWIMRYEVPFMDFVTSTGMCFDLVIHALMEIEGLCGRWRRAPYASATEAQMEKIRAFWTDLNQPREGDQ